MRNICDRTCNESERDERDVCADEKKRRVKAWSRHIRNGDENLRAGSPAWAFLSCLLLNGPEDWEQAAHTTASASKPLAEAAAETALAVASPSIGEQQHVAAIASQMKK